MQALKKIILTDVRCSGNAASGRNHISIGKVSERAGTADTSSFTRVFKDWTGFAPLAFRNGF